MALIKKKTIIETYEYYDVDADDPDDPNDDPDIPVDEFAGGPDLTVDNRIPDGQPGAGNVPLPYIYDKNGWEVIFDLDITEKKTKGLFLLKVKPITTFSGTKLAPQLFLRFQNKVNGIQDLLLSDTKGKNWLTLNEEHIFDVKARMQGATPPLPYDPSTWNPPSPEIPKTFLYLKTTESAGKYHYSGGFYIFPMDDSSDYVRL